MDLRHLRCFVALAEELHFGRAAERLHIEQSPLSRTIKELEDRLGVQLFNRDRRGTHLTSAGEAFLQEVRPIFALLNQARESARAAAAGQASRLRVAISDGITQPRIASLLALCREEEPAVTIRLCEVALAEQLRGLRNGVFDVGFARTADVGEGIKVKALWREPLLIAMPIRHPLLAHARIPLDKLALYPMVICHPEICEGYYREVERILDGANREINVVERVISVSMMLTLVSAGYGVGFATMTQISNCPAPGVITRPLETDELALTTYLLRRADEDISGPLDSFIRRTIREFGDSGFTD